MNKGGGKRKGSEFERDVCKFLSKWIQGTNNPLLFWRQPLSGGLATINELNKDMSGDIRSISEKSSWWPFSVEAKNGYPNTSFWQHFRMLKGYNIKNFWIQCTDDAKKSNKYPMLIYKKKGKQPIVGINNKVNKMLIKINKDLNNIGFVYLHWSENELLDDIVFYDMKDFFNIIQQNDIRKLNNET